MEKRHIPGVANVALFCMGMLPHDPYRSHAIPTLDNLNSDRLFTHAIRNSLR